MDKQMRLDVDVRRFRAKLHEETQQARRRVKLVDSPQDDDGFRQAMNDCIVPVVKNKATLTAKQMNADVVRVQGFNPKRSAWVKCTTPPPCEGYWEVTDSVEKEGLMYWYRPKLATYGATTGWPFPLVFGEQHYWRGLAEDPKCST